MRLSEHRSRCNRTHNSGQKISMFAVLLLWAAVSNAASDWNERFHRIVPENIAIVEILEKPDHRRITGQANDNADIGALMRAIEHADLGSAALQKVQRLDGLSHFVLHVYQ